MWNCKFGAKSGGYLRSASLLAHNRISSEYQPDIKNAAGFKMALRHFCIFLFVSVCFYMFLSASVSFYILLLFLYVSLFTGGSLFLLL